MKKIQISEVPLKVWMGLAIILMILMVWQVLTLSRMASEIKVLPQLFSPDVMRFNQYLEATNLDAGRQLTDRKLIEEMLVRFFVENYHFYIPDKWELQYRYGPLGPVARLSTPAVYARFMDGKEDLANQTQDVTRTAMANITRVTRQGDVFTVDFDTYEMDDLQVRKTGSRRATLRVGYYSGRVYYLNDFVNPFGLTVESYDETDNIKK